MSDYTTDEYGRVVLDSAGVFELWYQGGDHSVALVEQDADVIQFNEQCIARSKDDFVLVGETETPDGHDVRMGRWMIPDHYLAIAVEDYCLSLCATDAERDRVKHEMTLYREHDMVTVLQTLIFMIDQFRENKIVWGIGRGSSVASYVLYLIGVHKICPLKFGLNVEDFLR